MQNPQQYQGPPQPQQQQWPPVMAPPPHQYYQAPPPLQPPQIWNQQGPPPVPAQYAAHPSMQPPQYAAQPAAAPAAAGAADEIRTLWIGDLQYWMDETYLYNVFTQAALEVVTPKVIRNKQTNTPEGYGFVEFANRATAERALTTLNGTPMPYAGEQRYRLNWASNGSGEKRGDDGADHTIFVGDLAADVTDAMLQETFQARYSSVKGAKVVLDRVTGRSKGYGFVRFVDQNEQTRALTEMNGVYCSTRAIKVGPAANKKSMGTQQQYPSNVASTYQGTQGTESENDPNNTTIFVGGLDPNVTEDYLRQVFSQHGELGYVKIPPGKRCGFVQFLSRANAEQALGALNGTQLGGQSIRLSWGRSPQNKQTQQEQPNQQQQQWNGSYAGYGQQGYDGYNNYAAAPPAQDPNMYAYQGYPGYGNYQQQPAPPTQQ